MLLIRVATAFAVSGLVSMSTAASAQTYKDNQGNPTTNCAMWCAQNGGCGKLVGSSNKDLCRQRCVADCQAKTGASK